MNLDALTCHTLCSGGLPAELMCRKCTEVIEIDLAKKLSGARANAGSTRRTRCKQPFHSKYKNHLYKAKRVMFTRVWAYILQHLAVSASDPLSAFEVETLVGNDTTTSHTPFAPIDANANGGRVLQHNCRTIKVVAKSGSDAELLESLLACFTYSTMKRRHRQQPQK
jgi:hypothetical protein